MRAEVEGIGDVLLEVKTRAGRTGANSRRAILLKDVLYAPTSCCNIVGNPILDDFNLIQNTATSYSLLRDKQTGASAGIVDQVRLPRMRLVGHSATESSLEPDTKYVINNAWWSDSEQARWSAFQSQARHTMPSLNADEKARVKKHYGNEWKFLRAYGLNLSKDDERAEGREILKGLIAEDAMDHGVDDEESEDDADIFMRECEEDPTSHVADYQFEQEDLDFIKKHYQHSGNFMLSYGLKPWDAVDGKEAALIVRSMRHD